MEPFTLETTDVAAAAPGAVAPGAPGAAPRTENCWDQAPLRHKIALLVVLAAVGGVLLGVTLGPLTRHAWLLPAAMGMLMLLILALGQHWVCEPFERLIHSITTAQLRRRATVLRQLPVDREDEIGQIARLVCKSTLEAIRNENDARQLRRTIDHRVTRATRRACGQLQNLAMRDPLTDVANRRCLDQQLGPLILSVREANEDLVCMMIDLDHFKQVNDQLGHAAGDSLLVFLASLLRALVRRHDLVVRMGGDEFAAFLPACTLTRAREIGRQLTKLLQQHLHATMPADLPCGVSLGIASLRYDLAVKEDQRTDPAAPMKFDPNLDLSQALLQRADERLYAAKRGRDQAGR